MGLALGGAGAAAETPAVPTGKRAVLPEEKLLVNRSTVGGVSEMSGTSTIAVLPRARVARMAWR